MIIAFTGHRPNKLGGYNTPNPIYTKVIQALSLTIDSIPNIEEAISGMALGVDQWAAQLCLDKGIKLHAALPFKGQESFWPPKAKTIYHEILSKAHKVTEVNEPGYYSWKMQQRNEFMVDQLTDTGILIAVWDGTEGGTANCVKYALDKIGSERIIRINPNNPKDN